MLMDSLFAALEMFVCNMHRTVSEWTVGGLSVRMLSEAESDPLFAVLLKVTMVKAHGYFLEGLKPATFYVYATLCSLHAKALAHSNGFFLC